MCSLYSRENTIWKMNSNVSKRRLRLHKSVLKFTFIRNMYLYKLYWMYSTALCILCNRHKKPENYILLCPFHPFVNTWIRKNNFFVTDSITNRFFNNQKQLFLLVIIIHLIIEGNRVIWGSENMFFIVFGNHYMYVLTLSSRISIDFFQTFMLEWESYVV